MKALVTGIGGQDGFYSSRYLLSHNYEVFGITSRKNYAVADVDIVTADVSDFRAVSSIIQKVRPDELYHLASAFHSSEGGSLPDFDLFNVCYAANTKSTLNILEAIVRHSPTTKLFFASSAQIFGDAAISPQNEETPKNPTNVYAITKLAATNLCGFYRSRRNVFASVGILYNHESPRRRESYITKKVVKTAVDILHGRAKELAIGDLDAEVDWGYAEDYVEAMNRILQLASPDDFVISTGKTHSVKELVEHVFKYLGLDWRDYVKVEPSLLPAKSNAVLCGDNSKIRALTGWKPKTGFKEIIRIMVDQASQIRIFPKIHDKGRLDECGRGQRPKHLIP